MRLQSVSLLKAHFYNFCLVKCVWLEKDQAGSESKGEYLCNI